MSNPKKLSIFLLNCDWRNIFQESFHELKEKIMRDRLNPKVNDFFVYSWARTSYYEEKENFKTIHRKTRLDFFRPVLDLFSLLVVPKSLKVGSSPGVFVTYDFGFLPTLWMMKKKYGGKIVMCINNQPRLYSKVRKFGAIKSIYSSLVEKLFHGIPDEYFTINDTMRNYLENLGVPREKIHVFSMNTIDRDGEYIASAKRGVIRSRYSLPADAKVIVTAARLEAEKNYFTMLNNFSVLPKNYYLFVLGQGSLLNDLKNEVEKLDIKDRVFFEGFVQRNDIWNYYADADIFMLLSKVEALGIVFWEAMYMNVPVIGSDASGIVETIGNSKERGLIWKEVDGIEGFKEMINFCIEPSLQRQEMIEWAKKYVEGKIKNQIVINDIV